MREAVVVAKDSPTGARLVAYLVAAQGPLHFAELRERLSRALPDYMIPAAIVELDRLPLNANGKVDRKALPEPEATGVADQEIPLGAIENTLAEVWREVLGVERVGRHDNFFERGGDSILTLRTAARARERGLVLSAKQVFEHQTLSALASSVSSFNGGDALALSSPVVPLVDRRGPLVLSPAQSRQWFMWQLDKQSTAYHIAAGVRLHGPFSVEAMDASFGELVERHESLRTTFESTEDGKVWQRVQRGGKSPLVVVDVSAAPADRRQAMAEEEMRRCTQAPFDLETQGPLRVALIRLSAVDHLLVLAVHHIAADGWSMQVIVDEVVELYRAHVSASVPRWADLPIQYADYAAWQRRWQESSEHDRQLAWWRARLGDEHPVLELPADLPRAVVSRYRAARHEVVVPESLAERLHGRAKEQHSTVFTVLLAAFAALIHRYTSQSMVRVGVTNANRALPQTQGVVGCFANVQIMQCRVEGRMALYFAPGSGAPGRRGGAGSSGIAIRRAG